MTKKKKIVIIVTVALLVGAIIGLSIGLPLHFYYNPKADTEERYIQTVNGMTFFENDLDSAVAQTWIYDLVKFHFKWELPEGKTAKKVIVIGYDGCRLDALDKAENNNGAIKTLLNDGGKAYISYCGGKPYPEKNSQETSTAPGWCSMLTGQWADVHGITANGIIKSNDHLTLLTTLVEDKTINKSAFYVSWKGHFVNKNSTYKAEAEYVKEKNLNVVFDCSKDDEGTKSRTISDVSNKDCSDFIFTILEYCDHTGHKTGYYTGKEKYQEAFVDADNAALDIINAIKARESYDTEDWLIVIASDHGGIGRNHGKASIQERNTFIIAKRDL